MRWLSDNGWLAWVVLAAVLGVIEASTLNLVFLMLAAGALVGAVTSGLGAPLVLQVVVALVVSVAMVAAVRPVALRHLHRSALQTRTGVGALVGRQALVLERVDQSAGRVKVAGEVWLARSHDPTAAIRAGQTVDVVSIDGATAVVLDAERPAS